MFLKKNTLSALKIGYTYNQIIDIYKIKDVKNFMLDAKLGKENNNFKVIGSGTNIVFSDGQQNKETIFRNRIKFISSRKESEVICSTGILLKDFIIYLKNKSLDMSSLYDIPGTIGGAVINNAGAYGKEISEYFVYGYALINSEFKIINKEDLKFSYRESKFKRTNNFFLLYAVFEVPKNNKIKIENNLKKISEARNKFNIPYPNCGCVFKNCIISDMKVSTGIIIDKLNTNFDTNNLQLYEKHKNIIINKKNIIVSHNEFNKIIKEIKKKVNNENSISLELELEIY